MGKLFIFKKESLSQYCNKFTNLILKRFFMHYLEKYGISDRFLAFANQYPDLLLARIVAQYRGIYRIACEEEEIFAEISGKFSFEASELTDYPAVGDYVMVQNDKDAERAIIHHVLPRKSIFQRSAVGISNQSQLVATNIDIVFLCMSLNNNFNLNRLERYISIAWNSGATPIILLTKSDLAGNKLQEMIQQVESIALYTDIITISIYDDDIELKFAPFIKKGITAAFIGSSGVGKSTVINKLLGNTAIATQEVGFDDKGKHTTTGREIFLLESGGVLIDTAGMREIGVDSADMSSSFADIEELAKNCKFKDCTHNLEPNCAIKKAIEEGIISPRRFGNYLKILHESSYEGLSSKQREEAKLNRMFSEFGGMKNSRNVIREKQKKK